MKASRRHLIKVGTLAGAAVAVAPLNDLLSGPAEAAPRPKKAAGWAAAPAYFIRSTFESRLRDAFAVKGPKGSANMRLVAVGDVPSARTAGTVGHQDCFTAVFGAPLSVTLGQDTYQVTNKMMGTFSLFLVPGGQTRNARFYVATFNRMTA